MANIRELFNNVSEKLLAIGYFGSVMGLGGMVYDLSGKDGVIVLVILSSSIFGIGILILATLLILEIIQKYKQRQQADNYQQP